MLVNPFLWMTLAINWTSIIMKKQKLFTMLLIVKKSNRYYVL